MVVCLHDGGVTVKWQNLLCGLTLALSVVAASSVSLYAQPSFYQGKTLTVIVSSDAGGTVDMRVKALAPVLRKYIPGQSVGAPERVNHTLSRAASRSAMRSSGSSIPTE